MNENELFSAKCSFQIFLRCQQKFKICMARSDSSFVALQLNGWARDEVKTDEFQFYWEKSFQFVKPLKKMQFIKVKSVNSLSEKMTKKCSCSFLKFVKPTYNWAQTPATAIVNFPSISHTIKNQFWISSCLFTRNLIPHRESDEFARAQLEHDEGGWNEMRKFSK